MASAAGNAHASKKRNAFLSHFLSTRNLSIFRNKTSTTSNHTLPSAKDSQHYKSQVNITSQATPVPMCIGRGWLKKRLKRPVSLDLELVKTLAQPAASPPTGNDDDQPQPATDLGTIMDRSSAFVYLSLRRQRETRR